MSLFITGTPSHHIPPSTHLLIPTPDAPDIILKMGDSSHNFLYRKNRFRMRAANPHQTNQSTGWRWWRLFRRFPLYSSHKNPQVMRRYMAPASQEGYIRGIFPNIFHILDQIFQQSGAEAAHPRQHVIHGMSIIFGEQWRWRWSFFFCLSLSYGITPPQMITTMNRRECD